MEIGIVPFFLYAIDKFIIKYAASVDNIVQSAFTGYHPQIRKFREIADILCITEDQVKVNIFRARQTVKQRFQQFDRYGL